MICYKITDRHMRTFSGCRWKLGKWRKTSDTGGLCSSGLIHAYEHPLLAVLHDPIHGGYLAKYGARLFKCEARGKILHDGQMKMGATEMRLVKEIAIPYVTPEHYIRYAILCAAEVTQPDRARDWWAWAVNWWVGLDRTAESAALVEWEDRSREAAAWEEWEQWVEWVESAAARAAWEWAVSSTTAVQKVAARAAQQATEAAARTATRSLDLLSLAKIADYAKMAG